MPNGFGYGRGRGFGFRGSSPPWPYVGMGRGGLPRCWYFLGDTGAPVTPGYWRSPHAYYGGARDVPYGAPYGPGGAPFAPQVTRDSELEFLKREAEGIADYLKDIETRIEELTSDKGQSQEGG